MSMTPLFVSQLFAPLSGRLLDLLKSLDADDWQRQTLSSKRTVKDIASHLLDGSLRRLSLQRDGYRATDADCVPQPDETLLSFLNRLNQDWETATRRLSPQVLINLIEWADVEFAALMMSLNPFETAPFPVAWAGEEQSRNWMDIAREYTEKWHHTQQIFEATSRASTILNHELGYPCLDIFMQALPFTYRDVTAEQGSVVAVKICGKAGGSWFIERRDSGWQQRPFIARPAQATVTMPDTVAWKLVTKRQQDARTQFPEVELEGDLALGSHVFGLLSVMA